MTGDGLHDVMKGGGGSDTLMGGRGGYNVLIGEAGDDTAVYEFGIEFLHWRRRGIGFTQLAYLPDFLRGVSRNVGIDYLQAASSTCGLPTAPSTSRTAAGNSTRCSTCGSNLDVFHAGANAMEHFNTFGWREGRDPNTLFDTSAYLAVNKDVAAAGINPLDHYHQSGWREGRDPGLLFDTKLYLLKNPDVAAAGVDPFEHYLTFGRFEFRSVDSAIGEIKSASTRSGTCSTTTTWPPPASIRSCITRPPAGARGAIRTVSSIRASICCLTRTSRRPASIRSSTITSSAGRKAATRRGGFRTSAYLAKNPDVAAAGVDPLEHFLIFGIYEGRDPLGL